MAIEHEPPPPLTDPQRKVVVPLGKPDPHAVIAQQILKGSWGVAELVPPLPDIPWLCEGLRLCPGAPIIVGGYGYSGKTIALQSLMLSIAARRDVWGLYAAGEGRVLHVDYEQGTYLTKKRYKLLARGMAIDFEYELERDHLRVVNFPELWLDTKDARDTWHRLADGFRVVLIDSLSAAAPSTDEIDRSIRKPLDMLSWVSERTGVLFIVLHHASKQRTSNAHQTTGGEPEEAKFSLRGNSSIFDAAGGVYVFQAKKGEPTTVKHEKERMSGRELEDFGLRFEDVEPTTDDEDRTVGLRVVHLEAEQVAAAKEKRLNDTRKAQGAKASESVREILKASPGLTSRELKAAASATGIGWRLLEQGLLVLRDAIEVREEKVGRAVVKRHYLRA